MKSQLFCTINREGSNRYGYIANLCVAKSARRQGIACNMLRFTVESARLSGNNNVKTEKIKNGVMILYLKPLERFGENDLNHVRMYLVMQELSKYMFMYIETI